MGGSLIKVKSKTFPDFRLWKVLGILWTLFPEKCTHTPSAVYTFKAVIIYLPNLLLSHKPQLNIHWIRQILRHFQVWKSVNTNYPQIYLWNESISVFCKAREIITSTSPLTDEETKDWRAWTLWSEPLGLDWEPVSFSSGSLAQVLPNTGEACLLGAP